MSAGSGSGIKGEEQTLDVDAVTGESVGGDAVTGDGEVLGDNAKVGDILPIMKTSWFVDSCGVIRKDETFTFFPKTSAADGLIKTSASIPVYLLTRSLVPIGTRSLNIWTVVRRQCSPLSGFAPTTLIISVKHSAFFNFLLS